MHLERSAAEGTEGVLGQDFCLALLPGLVPLKAQGLHTASHRETQGGWAVRTLA